MSFSPKTRFTSHAFLLLTIAALSVSCIKVKKESKADVLLKVEDASQAQLLAEINRFASVNSIHAKMDLKFEDNSFAAFGSKEVYRQADGDVTVQRPGKILLKVQVPILKSDVAQMTSDGNQFRVAVLQDGGSGKYKKFVKGTNGADYTKLQKTLSVEELKDLKEAKQSVSAFSNMRPQHFTDAMLVRPTDADHIYTQSTIYQHEEDTSVDKKSPIRYVTRGYYLLDEYRQSGESGLVISRRFWFDRVGGIRLARQQLFDAMGEIESDITYGSPGRLGENTQFANLPLQIQVTRIKERYSLRFTYQSPDMALIGRDYPATAFVLQNTWNLEEVDLDKKLAELGDTLPAGVKSTTSLAH
ncbi:MAG TPA: hypothetical protein VGO43_11645 [Pyrinomonadaceae bacterium]|jgi:hypothetical protein|nr:hypothetical protein [Pyrinomonadaceae bacterium]